VAKSRTACAALVAAGAVRLNRQPVDKPHARLRAGDVLTLALGEAVHGRVLVWRVLGLAARRGPAAAARLLYQELPPAGG
jgi:ribosome-associated heat shock protein Hsp15